MPKEKQNTADMLEAEQEVGTQRRLNDAPPLGFGPNGEPNIVERGAKPFEPELAVEDDEQQEDADDLSDLDDIAALGDGA